jgi:hypothetical protein
MKVGDLIAPGRGHGLYGYDCRSNGIVIECLEKNKTFNEGVIVRWNDGDIELEIPDWLEVINETRQLCEN